MSAQLIPGGFIGVDIFFVLSGFLITSIILSEKKSTGAFSFKHFYTRRIKRILPPLWPVILCCAVAAVLLFNTENFKSFSWSAISATVFSANHYFASTTSYFHNPGDSSILLHLWSLSVEEQFYLVWPLLLLAGIKIECNDRLKLLILIGSTLLSFIGAHLMASTGRFETAAFYSLPPRAGELMIGGTLAFYQQSALKQRQLPSLGWLGLLFVLAPFVLYSHSTTFPGLTALIPCFGVVLVLSQFSKSSFVYHTILGNTYAQYIGKISYSLYLWHWPLLALPRYLYGDLSISALISLVSVAFLLSHLSWRYLELPIRQSSLSMRGAILYLFALPTVALLLILTCRNLVPNSGISHDTTSYSERYTPFCYKHGISAECKFGDLNVQSTALLFGDSHAGHFTPFWDSLGTRLGIAIDAFSAQTCYPMIDQDRTRPSVDPSIKDKVNCPPHLELIENIIDNYDIIILAASWSIYTDGPRAPRTFNFFQQLERQLTYLNSHGKKVVIMAQVPWFIDRQIETYQNRQGIPIEKLRNLLNPTKPGIPNFKARTEVQLVNERLLQISSRFPDTIVMTSSNTNPASAFLDEQLIYANSDHLSPPGSIALANQISDIELAAIRVFLSTVSNN